MVINKMSSAIVHSYYFTEVGPSVAAVFMLYIDSLPSLTAQARSSSNPWPLFREDKRFSKLHKFLGKILCVPATSDVVERVFSHGGLFMRPHSPLRPGLCQVQQTSEVDLC